MNNSAVYKFLAVFLFLIGISAIIGGYALLFTNWINLPLSYLRNSPFSSYLIPGLILAGVVGGTHTLASILLWTKHKYALEFSAIAGFGILIWIYIEIYITHQSSFLQTMYFVSGVITLVLTFYILRSKYIKTR